MALPSLDDGQRLLACLAVAVRRRDPVLVQQIAARADRLLTDSTIRRTFNRLKSYGLTETDMDWLRSIEAA